MRDRIGSEMNESAKHISGAVSVKLENQDEYYVAS